MNGNQIVNVYDASGRKLRTTSYTLNEPLATPATQVLQLSYVLGSVRETTITYNGNQQTTITWPHKEMLERPHTTYIYTTEGYVAKYSVKTQEYPKYTYYYYRRDHLGNNVAVWNATADSTLQRTFYYASGLPMSCSTGQSTQSRKYNGKEYVEDHGFDVYDYGFRGYYATIGRFTCIDPLAEQTPWQSPYVYADNNFINNVDLWGLSATKSGSGGVYTTSDPDKIAALLEHLVENNTLDGFDLSDWESGFGAAKWWIDETNGTFSFTYFTIGGGGGGTLDSGIRMDEWNIINVTYSLSNVHTSSILGDMAYGHDLELRNIWNTNIDQWTIFNDVFSITNILAQKQPWNHLATSLSKLGKVTAILPIMQIIKEVPNVYDNGIKLQPAVSIVINAASLSSNIYVAGVVFMIDCYSVAFDYFVDSFNYLQSRLNDFNYWGDAYFNGF